MRLLRTWRIGLAVACVAISGPACGGSDATLSPAAPSPSADNAVHVGTEHVVVVTVDGEVEKLDEQGRVVASLGQVPPSVGDEVNAISVSPDGQVLVSTLNDHDEACRAVVYRVMTNDFEKYVDGAAAAFADDGSQLAYIRYDRDGEFCPRAQLVIRRLATGTERDIDYPGQRMPEGTPPAWPISWSPDGTKFALMTADGLSVIATGSGDADVVGDSLPEDNRPTAPVFLDNDTVAAMTGCCIGPLHMTAISIGSDESRELFTVPGPVRSIQRDRGGEGLWLTVEEGGLWHWDGDKLQHLPVEALITSG
jgi:hypothetical protein